MKRFLFMLTLAAASMIGNQADAAIRLVVKYGAMEQVFYANTNGTPPDYITLNQQANFSFNDGSVNLTGTIDTLNTNAPGETGLTPNGLLSQSINLLIRPLVAGVVALSDLTSTLSIIDDVLVGSPYADSLHLSPLNAVDAATVKAASEKAFTSPSMTNALVTSTLSVNNSDSNLLGGTVTGSTTVRYPAPPHTINNPGVAANGGVGNQLQNLVFAVPPTGYYLKNQLKVTGWSVDGRVQGTIYGQTSEVIPTGRPVNDFVPEPTSMALAGFAGIGMAIGAIRRRRQPKLAA